MMMEKIISNQFDAHMSVQAVNDVVNVKIILNELRMGDKDICKTHHGRQLCAMLHQHILGWS